MFAGSSEGMDFLARCLVLIAGAAADEGPAGPPSLSSAGGPVPHSGNYQSRYCVAPANGVLTDDRAPEIDPTTTPTASPALFSDVCCGPTATANPTDHCVSPQRCVYSTFSPDLPITSCQHVWSRSKSIVPRIQAIRRRSYMVIGKRGGVPDPTVPRSDEGQAQGS